MSISPEPELSADDVRHWRADLADHGFTDEQIQGIEKWVEMDGVRLRVAEAVLAKHGYTTQEIKQKKRPHDLKVIVCWCGSTHSWEKAKR